MSKNKNSIGEPVKVTSTDTVKPEPVQEPKAAPQPAETPSLPDPPTGESSPQENPLAELEKLKAELAEREAQVAEREKRLHQEEKALQKMSESLDEKIQANPGAQPETGVLLTDLQIPDEIKAGADPGAPYELRKRYRDYVKQNYKSVSTLKPYRVTLKSKDMGPAGRDVEVLAVDPSDARRIACRRLGIIRTEAVTARVETA